jgi:hypothetical protein
MFSADPAVPITSGGTASPARRATPRRAPSRGAKYTPCREPVAIRSATPANGDAQPGSATAREPSADGAEHGAPPHPSHRPVHARMMPPGHAGVDLLAYPRVVNRSYTVRTYGCQMNVHDSERMAGLLESSGYVRAAESEQADVVVINTCAVRENADNRLYGNLGHLRPVKDAHPGLQIAVGGCLAQKDRAEIVRRAPWVDVVFGTHNVGSLPVLLERARHNATAQVEIAESLEVFPSTLPARRGVHLRRAGSRSRWAATTPARSASSPRCAAPRRTAAPATSWPRCGRWPPTGCSR